MKRYLGRAESKKVRSKINAIFGGAAMENREAQPSIRFNNTISSWVISPFLINDLRVHESNAGPHIRSQPHGILDE